MKNLIKDNFKKFLLLVLSLPTTSLAALDCVNIYYDRGPDNYWIGQKNAIFMQNLLGHFPHLQQIVAPIETYKKGDLDKCKANIYIGTHFKVSIPEDFFTDFMSTSKNVAWLGYNIWRKPEILQKVFNYRYEHLTTLNMSLLDSTAKPTFFKWIDYKGERFKKFGEWSQTAPATFHAPFEMTALSPLNLVDSQTKVLATAVHNGTGEKLPYILRNQNHFYIADSVFSYMHESDRYLVFSDVLFDILDEQPRHRKKMAVMRIEDVHPMIKKEVLQAITEALHRLQVPISISLIPFYYDSLNYDGRPAHESFVPASNRPAFVEWIKDLQQKNATFIWHGVTHQYSKMKNPHTGTSGDDFEFWNARSNTPVLEDSPQWVLNRLYIGFKELQKVNITPTIWLTPHYQASALDNILFSYVMPWSMGRVIYQNIRINGTLPEPKRSYWFTHPSPQLQKERLAGLEQVNVTTVSPWSGQLFPYEIYGDVYGQRVLPENLGNVQPAESDQVVYPRSVDEIIADARRNLVLRDVWASYFFHPFLMQLPEGYSEAEYDGDTREMERLVREIKNMGYEFINIDEFARQNVDIIRPEPKVNWGRINQK